MRRFRAIIETNTEPQDHEVLWYWKNKLLYWGNDAWEPFLTTDATEILYETEEGKYLSVKEILDKLTEGINKTSEDIDKIEEDINKIEEDLAYVPLEITSFNLAEAGLHEFGSSINTLNFSWEYNKEIKKQSINGIEISPSVRSITLSEEISEPTDCVLRASDGTNEVEEHASINYVDCIYYGVRDDDGSPKKLGKLYDRESFTVDIEGERALWIFVPNLINPASLKIWHDNIDSTDSFRHNYVHTFTTDTGLTKQGTMYVTKLHVTGTVTMKVTL